MTSFERSEYPALAAGVCEFWAALRAAEPLFDGGTGRIAVELAAGLSEFGAAALMRGSSQFETLLVSARLVSRLEAAAWTASTELYVAEGLAGAGCSSRVAFPASAGSECSIAAATSASLLESLPPVRS